MRQHSGYSVSIFWTSGVHFSFEYSSSSASDVSSTLMFYAGFMVDILLFDL